MYYELLDFNGAAEYFEEPGAELWSEIAETLDLLIPQLQPSDQRGKVGVPIFDPKATNALLTEEAALRGWSNVLVPPDLQAFGVDWDAGKGPVLAEWQFSNYPFLWNNIIRTEAIFKSGVALPGLAPIQALIIVTKSGCFPASNSTLYYEQAAAQLNVVTTLGVFDIPIRLVGLMIPPNDTMLTASWNTYPGRYSRAAAVRAASTFAVTWGRPARHGHAPARLTLLEA